MVAIFARRAIQNWLEDNLPCVGREGTRQQVRRLNDRKNPANVIPAVWEVGIIFALRKLGRVEFERPQGTGRTRPDVWFQPNDKSFEFLADIATVSDAGLHDRSWVTDFQLALLRMKIKEGIGHLPIQVDFGRIETGKFGDSQVRAALPPKGQGEAFLARIIRPFLRTIASDPTQAAARTIQETEFQVRVSYDPQSRFGGGAYPAYTLAYSLEGNPVFRTLREKAKQLKASGYSGLRGIILCDGGCDLVHRSGQVGAGCYRLDQVVQHFLMTTETVGFVLVIAFQSQRQIFHSTMKHSLEARLFINKAIADQAGPLQVLLQVPHVLPLPIQEPWNAFPKGINGPPKSRPSQAFKASRSFVAMEVADLLGLMTGTLEQDDWLFEWLPTLEPVPFDQIPKRLITPAFVFSNMHATGQMPASMRIVKQENDDADLVEFDFEGRTDNSFDGQKTIFSTDQNFLSVDAKELIGLLGGEIKQSVWLDTWSRVDPDGLSRLRLLTLEGHLLNSVRALARVGDGLPLIEFGFGAIDAGVGEFQVPKG